MKKFGMFTILFLAALAPGLVARPASALNGAGVSGRLQQVTLKVEGMTCGGCALAVRKTLEKQKGVRSVELSLEKGQAVVEAIKGKVRPEDLAVAVTKIGYKATVIRAD